MIISDDGATHELRAIYFDNQEHIIHYVIKSSENSAEFLSEGGQGAPRLRLTYASAGADRLNLKFEIAPPEKNFTSHIEASARRDKPDQ
jgi:hypothetical protein